MEQMQAPTATLELDKLAPDTKTLYAAAMVCKRHEIQHTAQQFDTRNTLEARKAHKFVALNLNFVATTILMMAGVSHEEAVAQLLGLHEITVKDLEAAAEAERAKKLQ